MAKRPSQRDRRVTAADVIAFIERTLFVPEGRYVDQPLRLQPWQKDFIRLVYDTYATFGLTRRKLSPSSAARLLLCRPTRRHFSPRLPSCWKGKARE